MEPIQEVQHDHKCCKKIVDKTYKAMFGYSESWICGKPATYMNGNGHKFCTKHSGMQRYVIRQGDTGPVLSRHDTEQRGRIALQQSDVPGIRLQKLSPGHRRDIAFKP